MIIPIRSLAFFMFPEICDLFYLGFFPTIWRRHKKINLLTLLCYISFKFVQSFFFYTWNKRWNNIIWMGLSKSCGGNPISLCKLLLLSNKGYKIASRKKIICGMDTILWYFFLSKTDKKRGIYFYQGKEIEVFFFQWLQRKKPVYADLK